MSDTPSQQPQPQPQPPGPPVAAVNMKENAEAARLRTNRPVADESATVTPAPTRQTPHGVSGAATPSRLSVPPLLPPPAVPVPSPPTATSVPANDGDGEDDDDKEPAVDAMGIGVEVMAPDGTSVPARFPVYVAPTSDPFNAKAVVVQGRGAVGAHAVATARHKSIAPPEIIDSASYATGVAPPVADDGESVMVAQRGPGAPRVRRSPDCLRQAVDMYWRPCLVLAILILIVLIVAAATR